jgi:rubredoxin
MGRIPAWHKGKLIECDVCGFWYGTREGKLRKQRNLWVCPQCFDKLTDQEREANIQSRLRRSANKDMFV